MRGESNDDLPLMILCRGKTPDYVLESPKITKDSVLD